MAQRSRKIHDSLYVSLRILKDCLLRVPGIARLDEQRHATRTGQMDDPQWVIAILKSHIDRIHHGGGMIQGARVLELGPGRSLAQAFLVYLLGADSVTAVDIRRYANERTGRGIYRRLIDEPESWLLLRGEETPSVDDSWRSRAEELLPEGAAFPRTDAALRYEVIEGARLPLADGSIDLVYSCSVLEHVPDIASTYRELARILRPGGLMSHIVDLKDHHHPEPFHFLRYGDRLWSAMQGRSAGFVNRLRASDHLHELERAGFVIQDAQRRLTPQAPLREDLAPRFHGYSDEDLRTRALLFTARCERT